MKLVGGVFRLAVHCTPPIFPGPAAGAMCVSPRAAKPSSKPIEDGPPWRLACGMPRTANGPAACFAVAGAPPNGPPARGLWAHAWRNLGRSIWDPPGMSPGRRRRRGTPSSRSTGRGGSGPVTSAARLAAFARSRGGRWRQIAGQLAQREMENLVHAQSSSSQRAIVLVRASRRLPAVRPPQPPRPCRPRNPRMACARLPRTPAAGSIGSSWRCRR